MKFVFSEKCLEYSFPSHPESPSRVKIIYDFLTSIGAEFIQPIPCSEEDILLVHTKELLEKVKTGAFFDPDTPNLPNIYEYAKLSAGGAIKAMEITEKGDTGFSIMRPPGHHSGKNFLGGFCYFNNIAIAIAKANKKACIIDIDCHHGNGTEDIFIGKENVLYISLHRFGYFYPGTGFKSIKNILNYPLSYGISEKEYLETLDKAINEVIKFSPEIIGVSVGFDTYKFDPVGGLGLDKSSYRIISKKIREINIPTFYVLEGGYSNDLPECFSEFLQGI